MSCTISHHAKKESLYRSLIKNLSESETTLMLHSLKALADLILDQDLGKKLFLQNSDKVWSLGFNVCAATIQPTPSSSSGDADSDSSSTSPSAPKFDRVDSGTAYRLVESLLKNNELCLRLRSSTQFEKLLRTPHLPLRVFNLLLDAKVSVELVLHVLSDLQIFSTTCRDDSQVVDWHRLLLHQCTYEINSGAFATEVPPYGTLSQESVTQSSLDIGTTQLIDLETDRPDLVFGIRHIAGKINLSLSKDCMSQLRAALLALVSILMLEQDPGPGRDTRRVFSDLITDMDSKPLIEYLDSVILAASVDGHEFLSSEIVAFGLSVVWSLDPAGLDKFMKDESVFQALQMLLYDSAEDLVCEIVMQLMAGSIIRHRNAKTWIKSRRAIQARIKDETNIKFEGIQRQDSGLAIPHQLEGSLAIPPTPDAVASLSHLKNTYSRLETQIRKEVDVKCEISRQREAVLQCEITRIREELKKGRESEKEALEKLQKTRDEVRF